MKEPYFKLAADGRTHSIRVDHLSDIMYLLLDDERVPDDWKLDFIEEADAGELRM